MRFDEDKLSDEDLAAQEKEMKKAKAQMISPELWKSFVGVVGTGVIFALIMIVNLAIAFILGKEEEEEG